jgi:hypothetical protein
MIDMKSSLKRRDAYKFRRDLAAATVVALMIYGSAQVAELVAENHRLQDELIQTLAVSIDMQAYMETLAHAQVFTEQDLD